MKQLTAHRMAGPGRREMGKLIVAEEKGDFTGKVGLLIGNWFLAG